MNPNKLFPLITAQDLGPVRDFYTGVVDATITMETPGYLQLRFGDDKTDPEIAFMAAAEGSGRDGQPATPFAGDGLIVSIPVADADEHRRSIIGRGGKPASAEDRPWGWRSYFLTDPTGIVLDFFHVMNQPASV